MITVVNVSYIIPPLLSRQLLGSTHSGRGQLRSRASAAATSETYVHYFRPNVKSSVGVLDRCGAASRGFFSRKQPTRLWVIDWRQTIHRVVQVRYGRGPSRRSWTLCGFSILIVNTRSMMSRDLRRFVISATCRVLDLLWFASTGWIRQGKLSKYLYIIFIFIFFEYFTKTFVSKEAEVSCSKTKMLVALEVANERTCICLQMSVFRKENWRHSMRKLDTYMCAFYKEATRLAIITADGQ